MQEDHINREDYEYRNFLIKTKNQLNDNFDKLIVTLSGGALALSMAFLKDIVKLQVANHSWMLALSWFLLIFSVGFVLGEIYFGIEAYRKALAQLDGKTIRQETAGGIFASITKNLGRLAAIFLILGMVSIAMFVFINLENGNGTTTNATAETRTKT